MQFKLYTCVFSAPYTQNFMQIMSHHGSYKIDIKFENFLRSEKSWKNFFQRVKFWRNFGEITKFVVLALKNLC